MRHQEIPQLSSNFKPYTCEKAALPRPQTSSTPLLCLYFFRFIFIKFPYRKENALLLLLAGVVGSLDQVLMRPDNRGVAWLRKTKANTNKK